MARKTKAERFNDYVVSKFEIFILLYIGNKAKHLKVALKSEIEQFN